MYKYAKDIPRTELINLDTAFSNFFKKVKTKNYKKGKAGYPKFKSKKKDKQSFRLEGEHIVPTKDKIRLPRIGWLRLKEKGYIPTENIRILSATVSKRANKWFVSVNAEVEIPDIINTSDEIIGVDLGSKTLAVCSNGSTFENPKALKNNLKKLRQLDKKLVRQLKLNKNGSKNREKTKIKRQKLHYHISEIRKDSIHKMASNLMKAKPNKIVIEDLNVEGMKKNKKLSRTISDVGMGEVKRQFEYKCKWNSIQLVLSDRFYPSTQLCSSCGYRNEGEDKLTLGIRNWTCPNCGVSHDRDFNASVNLKNYVVGSTMKVYGEDVRPQEHGAILNEVENKQ